VKRLFDVLGVDYQQWRALVRAYIWVDYAALFGAFGPREARDLAVRLALAWGLLTFFGFGLATVVWLADDPFFASMTVITMVMFWSGLIVLGQPAGLAAPHDHEIVGFRPVSSRTLFAVRVTALLEPCLESTLLIGWMPVLAFASRGDGSLSMGVAAAAGIAGAAAFVSLALVALFGWLIQVVAPQRLAQGLSYAGAVAIIALTIGIMLATNHLVESDDPARIFEAVAPRDLRTMWFPGAWFAAYVLVADGSARIEEQFAVLLSLVALAAIAAGLRGRIAVGYSDRIANSIAAPSRMRAAGKAWTALRNENRAVAVLVASHLRADMRFQLAVASNLTMGALFTVMMTSFESLPEDPFVSGGDPAGLMAPLMALFFVPSQIYQSLVVSLTHEAAWVYFSTPANRAALVTAARDTVGAMIFVPAMVLLAAFYTYAFGHLLHAAVQVILLGLLGFGAFQGNILVAPRLPFSMPAVGTRPGGMSLFAPILVMLAGAPIFVAFQLVAYRGAIHTAAGFLALILVNLLLARLIRRRLARNSELLAYPS
jgi:hypothetical protein